MNQVTRCSICFAVSCSLAVALGGDRTNKKAVAQNAKQNASKAPDKKAEGTVSATERSKAKAEFRRALPSQSTSDYFVLLIEEAGRTDFERVKGAAKAVDRFGKSFGLGGRVRLVMAFRGNAQGDVESNQLVNQMQDKSRRFESDAATSKKSAGPVFVLETLAYKPNQKSLDFARRNGDQNSSKVETRWFKVERLVCDRLEGARSRGFDFLNKKEHATIKSANIIRFEKRWDAQAYVETTRHQDWQAALMQFRYTSPQALKMDVQKQSPSTPYRG